LVGTRFYWEKKKGEARGEDGEAVKGGGEKKENRKMGRYGQGYFGGPGNSSGSRSSSSGMMWDRTGCERQRDGGTEGQRGRERNRDRDRDRVSGAGKA